jgi:hypothetical protein
MIEGRPAPVEEPTETDAAATEPSANNEDAAEPVPTQ